MFPTIIAYILLIAFIFLSERFVRDKGKAKKFKVEKKIQLSTLLIIISLFFILFITIPLNYFQVGMIVGDKKLAWFGIVLLLVGMSIRVVAMRTLGSSYTRALLTNSKQQIIQGGMYKHIRHPGYAGTILGGIGFALVTMNWLVLAITCVLIILVYSYRIATEEKILIKKYGSEYREYMLTTKRIIPFIY